MLRQCSLKMLWITCCCGFLFFADIFSAASSSINAQTTPPPAVKKGTLLVIDGAISPAVADYCVRGIKRANANGSQLIVLQMDTPGGLDKSMRDIIKEIIASRVPVVSYVAPSGARAASAGTYILYASHIAAMAPATNLGAATPVSIGGGGLLPGQTPEKTQNQDHQDQGINNKDQQKDKNKETIATMQPDQPKGSDDAMQHKILNDAAAYIKGLADLHGRNAQWAVKAVRAADSLSAEQALKENVIDVIATDMADLLKQINGRHIKVLGQIHVLDSQNVRLEVIQPDWRTRLLTVITDPSVAYILLLLGIYGLFFEFANPGFVVPGIVGAICFLLAMYALQLLPINFAGLALLILGIIFMIVEAIMPSFGALGIGGVIAFVAGSILLLDTNTPGFGISWTLILLMALLNAIFFFGILAMAFRAKRRKIVSGREAMIGLQGYALEDLAMTGQVQVHAEIWQAQAQAQTKISKGDKIEVIHIQGLLLIVTPIEKQEGDRK